MGLTKHGMKMDSVRGTYSWFRRLTVDTRAVEQNRRCSPVFVAAKQRGILGLMCDGLMCDTAIRLGSWV